MKEKPQATGKSGKDAQRIHLYALGDTTFSRRVKAAAALSEQTMEEFVTATVTAKVDQVLAAAMR